MAELNKNKLSVKEQIESFSDIGRLELALVKEPRCLIEDNTFERGSDFVTPCNRQGHFRIHTHTPEGDGSFLNFNHVPSIPDLVGDFSESKLYNGKKFVIVATNVDDKVIGYFVYSPKFKKDLYLKITNPIRRLFPHSKYSLNSYESYYKKELKRLGISYNSRAFAMPGYLWDDNKKIFREKKLK